MSSKEKHRKCHLTETLKSEFPHIKAAPGDDDSIVKCNICNCTFTIARGGRASITKHNESVKHKTFLGAVASTLKVTTYYPNEKFLDHEKKFAYHTLQHNHSFRSMDCTSNLLQNFYDKKFHCARTKCEAIVKHVFFNYAHEKLQLDLKDAKFVTLLSDASNHKFTKLYPVLIRYFNFQTGVNVKILYLDEVPGETSDILSKQIKTVIDCNNMNNKVVAISADNTNTNFGGLSREGKNNVHKKLISALNKNIFGIGCCAHIASNAINSAANLMTVDVEVIIPKIYLYFDRFTVRVETLKEFCDEADVVFRALQGYSKTRFLSLMPAIERVLQMFEPLRSYFLSIEKCPKAIQDFFENDLSEVLLYFLHSQASMFHNTVMKIEGYNISCIEVNHVLNELMQKIESRLDENFIPLAVNSLLNRLDESNPGIKRKFCIEAGNFYANSLAYLKEWTKHTMDFNQHQ